MTNAHIPMAQVKLVFAIIVGLLLFSHGMCIERPKICLREFRTEKECKVFCAKYCRKDYGPNYQPSCTVDNELYAFTVYRCCCERIFNI
ncbi:hypothetical protein Lalb_Chr21g0309901 [Lupinus albus]|uniref:Knottin, scorpion toxin n=1 Tax=Lupinus albus TaxID=3870 RepID=A0A6A4NJ68_LUPAL|nr:hypothetical protein Lalb_Chr21g0309901 [Lupinus albus]